MDTRTHSHPGNVSETGIIWKSASRFTSDSRLPWGGGSLLGVLVSTWCSQSLTLLTPNPWVTKAEFLWALFWGTRDRGAKFTSRDSQVLGWVPQAQEVPCALLYNSAPPKPLLIVFSFISPCSWRECTQLRTISSQVSPTAGPSPFPQQPAKYGRAEAARMMWEPGIFLEPHRLSVNLPASLPPTPTPTPPQHHLIPSPPPLVPSPLLLLGLLQQSCLL